MRSIFFKVGFPLKLSLHNPDITWLVRLCVFCLQCDFKKILTTEAQARIIYPQRMFRNTQNLFPRAVSLYNQVFITDCRGLRVFPCYSHSTLMFPKCPSIRATSICTPCYVLNLLLRLGPSSGNSLPSNPSFSWSDPRLRFRTLGSRSMACILGSVSVFLGRPGKSV